MDIEKLIEQLRTDSLYADKASLEIMDLCMDAANALSTLQAENEKLRAAVDNWKKKYVEANGKWIKAENKWAGLDKAVRNGTVYRHMQEELNLTHEENQSLKDAIEKLRTELEQVKRELDICIKAVFGDCDYCKYDRSLPDDTSPCWHCKEYAAQEFVTGNYWQWRGPLWRCLGGQDSRTPSPWRKAQLDIQVWSRGNR